MMKKSILTIGAAIPKSDQKQIQGGGLKPSLCSDNSGNQCNPNFNGADCGPTSQGSLNCPSSYDCLCPVGQTVGTCYANWA